MVQRIDLFLKIKKTGVNHNTLRSERSPVSQYPQCVIFVLSCIINSEEACDLQCIFRIYNTCKRTYIDPDKTSQAIFIFLFDLTPLEEGQ